MLVVHSPFSTSVFSPASVRCESSGTFRAATRAWVNVGRIGPRSSRERDLPKPKFLDSHFFRCRNAIDLLVSAMVQIILAIVVNISMALVRVRMVYMSCSSVKMRYRLGRMCGDTLKKKETSLSL